MANSFIYTDWLSMESLRLLLNELKFGEYFNTDYKDDFGKEFPVGASVRVPLPLRATIRNGLAYNAQPLAPQFTTVYCDQIFGADFEWNSIEKALEMPRAKEAISDTILKPFMAQIAQELDSRLALFAHQNTNNITGALGVTPTDMGPYRAARRILKENACPSGDRGCIISPGMQEAVSAALATVFNPQEISSKAFKEGFIRTGAGLGDWWESMSLYQHTAGTWAGAVTTTGAGQSGSSLLITATAGDTFLKGDVFAIAGSNNVNPSTRRSVGTLKRFVVTQDLTAAGGGADALQIYPPIVGPGSQYQNVDALPGALAAMTLFPGTTAPNGKVGINGLVLQKDAFAMVGVKMEMPKAVEFSTQKQDPTTGIAVRFVRQWDNIQSRMTNRFDVLFGCGVLRPDNSAVRILSLV